jgi:hypothetical protein
MEAKDLKDAKQLQDAAIGGAAAMAAVGIAAGIATMLLSKR